MFLCVLRVDLYKGATHHKGVFCFRSSVSVIRLQLYLSVSFLLHAAAPSFLILAQTDVIVPPIVTFGIAAVLAIWAAYAFAGAGFIPKLPLMRPALLAITSVYLLRGLALFPAFVFQPVLVTPFIIWSSVIVMAFGIVYAIGTWQVWEAI